MDVREDRLEACREAVEAGRRASGPTENAEFVGEAKGLLDWCVEEIERLRAQEALLPLLRAVRALSLTVTERELKEAAQGVETAFYQLPAELSLLGVPEGPVYIPPLWIHSRHILRRKLPPKMEPLFVRSVRSGPSREETIIELQECRDGARLVRMRADTVVENWEGTGKHVSAAHMPLPARRWATEKIDG